MSEVQSRPRGSGRAGRGGRASRGGSRISSNQLNGDATAAEPALEDQGELGQLKKQYMTQLVTLNELFPDWTDEDLVFALEETDGDMQVAIERISEGNVSRFSDVKKKSKDKSRSKTSEPVAATKDVTNSATRGRGRGGFEGGRGGRGRGTERGRGSVRGGRGASVSSTVRTSTVPASASIADAGGWDSSANTAAAAAAPDGTWDQSADATTSGQWGSVVSSRATPSTASEGQKSSLIPEGSKKSWASMLAQPKQPPAVTKAAAEAPLILEQPPLDALPAGETSVPQVPEQTATPPTSSSTLDSQNIITPSGSIGDLTPPKDMLTEHNVENLPDDSQPLTTETTASTRDQRSAAGSVTPYGASQPQGAVTRPPMGGYATSAYKATGMPGRSASFQRRMMEQREAVVMPSNHAIDRTAVQFGSMGLNGEGKPIEVEEGREEAETRAQPPQQSPPSQPRASLPPVAPTAAPSESRLPDNLPTPKQAPGLPMPSQAQQPSPIMNQSISQPPTGPQGTAPSISQSAQQYGHYSRYGPSALAPDQSAPTQKPYDAFSHQLNYGQTEHLSMYPGQSQAPAGLPQQAPSQAPGFGQTPSDYSSQFAGEQQRGGYQSLYSNTYGQQGGSTQQDQNAPPQRSASGLGSGDASFPSSQAGQMPSRFAETPNSGNNTPNLPIGGQQHMGSQSQQGQMMHQQQHGQQGGYPYGQPYYGYNSYGAYMNQYPSQNYYNQQNYGAPFGSKGMYGQPHHGFGSFEHSSSPANTGGYGSSGMHGRDAFQSLGGEYGRSGSAQHSQGQHASGAGGFGGSMGESYGRGASSFPNQSSQYGPSTTGATEDSLKALQDPKTGPSPLLGQPGRPGSGMNATTGQGGNQSSFPPPQSHQQGFGGYSSQLQSNQGSQYSQLGGLGSQQGSSQNHQSGYGNYGGSFGNSYGNYGGRGGWGNNYH